MIPALAGPTGLAPTEVQSAVDRGRAYLLAQQTKDGSWGGRWAEPYPAGNTALSLLALMRSGVPADDPAVVKGLERLRQLPMVKTYSAALIVLALDAAYGPPLADPGRYDAEHPDYSARYFNRKAPEAVRTWLTQAAAWLVEHRAHGYWRYPEGEAGDLSNTQLAVLALYSAARLGVRLPDETWKDVLDAILAAQEADGPVVDTFAVPILGTAQPSAFKARGWGYQAGQPPRGSMTAGGVSSLVLIRDRLAANKAFQKQYAARVDSAIADGLAWLALRFSIDDQPGFGNHWLIYWAYSLERCCTLAGVERLGVYDWYALLGRRMLDGQDPDGSWNLRGESAGPVADTALALLFLTRATVRVAAPTATAGGGAGGVADGPVWERLPDRADLYRVTFSYAAPVGVKSVNLAGTMNDWNPTSLPMVLHPDRIWRLTLDLPHGEHLYKFVLDGGTWRHDPANCRAESDGQGGLNSLLILRE